MNISVSGSNIKDIIKKNVPASEKSSQDSALTSIKLPVIASSWNEKAVKTVKSTIRGSDAGAEVFGTYAEVNPLFSNTENADKYAEYKYKLTFTMGNSYANKLYIYDHIESANDFATDAPESKWKGLLKSVDVSSGDDTNLNNHLQKTSENGETIETWLEHVVFYSEKDLDKDLFNSDVDANTNYNYDPDTEKGRIKDGICYPEGENMDWTTEEKYKKEHTAITF